MIQDGAVNFQQEILNPVASVGVMSGWRRDAARLAAELLCQVSPAVADEVLDLRSALLDSRITPGGLLRAFFAARNRLESEHYLVFFRLRRVLEPALGVEISTPGSGPVREAVDFRYRDASQMIRGLRRERFEHDLRVQSLEQVRVRVCWRFAPDTAVQPLAAE